VQVESRCRETHKRLGVNAHVSVAVDKEMLECQPVERPRLDRLDPVVTEIQPAQVREVRESTDFDVLEAALADVEMFEDEVLGHVGPSHGRRREEVAVEVELKCV